MKHKIRIHFQKGINEYKVETGTNVLEFLQAHNFFVDAPCGGKRDCGKCKIKLTGAEEGPDERESELLGEKSIAMGYRLACKVRIFDDLDIFTQRSVNENHDVSEKRTHRDKEHELGMAFDVGTTTLVAYLYDLQTEECIDIYSALNPQKAFGADIISRIEYSGRSTETADTIRTVLIDAINGIMAKMCESNFVPQSNIRKIVFVGNTTMMHFVMALPVNSLAVAPFNPVTTELRRLKAVKLGLHLSADAEAVIFPSVSAFIGADTVAAVLSLKISEAEQIELLVDLGTNGETVLGNRDWMISCSTAAGPAFEGANIRCGVGGVDGAIDAVTFENGVKYSSIGGIKPIGICGSGLSDLVALLLRTGIIDKTGRILGNEEAAGRDGMLKSRLTVKDGMKAFIIAFGEETSGGDDIYITQKDIREFQNAKAAICAGIKILARLSGIDMNGIAHVYLAGGFGQYLDVQNAVTTGIIPKELASKVRAVGNAAGRGAVEGLLSEDAVKLASEISSKIKYTELSETKEFAEIFIENMDFLM